MDNSTAAALVLGPLLSLVISFIVSEYAGSRYRTYLTLAACFVAAAVSMLLSDTYAKARAPISYYEALRLLLLNFVAVWGMAVTAYARVYKPTGIADYLEERGTKLGEHSEPTPAKRKPPRKRDPID